MDNPLILPRLRLSRHSSPRMKQDNSATPIAGPSRLHSDDFLNVPSNGDDDDSQSTPRLSTLAKLASEKNSPINLNSPGLPADTPAARLRALLARVPNNTPPASSRSYRPPSPSDLESDFESVGPSPEAPSIARESLKELFSHALRDPGDTPLKGRKRRNSVDASPNVDRTVERERAYNRGKRASMSDEEAEKMSRTCHYRLHFASCIHFCRCSTQGRAFTPSLRSSGHLRRAPGTACPFYLLLIFQTTDPSTRSYVS